MKTSRIRLWGLAAGAGSGVLDTLFFVHLGIDFSVSGRDLTLVVMAYLAISFAALGYAIGYLHDARARERRDAETIRAQAEALMASRRIASQNEKLAAIGRLAAGIAHEVRNPLGVIRASASMVQESFDRDDESWQACRFICDEIDRLNGLITSLLAFARPTEPRLCKLSVENAVERALELAGSELAVRNIRVARETLGPLPEIEADPNLLSQAFLDVVTNSVEALPEGGLIALRLRSAENGVEVEIADDGPGVAREDALRVFEPFFTTKAAGTGLGLAMTSRIIERHGGDISVVQGRGAGPGGNGACFHVRIPLEAPRAVAESYA
ncbi:MAG: nitrogen regulation protein NR(II) [Myxococcota bacterium]